MFASAPPPRLKKANTNCALFSMRGNAVALLLSHVAVVTSLAVTPQDGGLVPLTAAPAPAADPATAAFTPSDPLTCRSIALGVVDSWCIATCTKSCPPQMCECEGDNTPVNADHPVVPGMTVDPMAADPSKPTNLDPGSPEYLCKVHGKCNLNTGVDPSPGQHAAVPVAPSPVDDFAVATEKAGLPNPKDMDPSSAEFMCKIHGQCNMTKVKPLANASAVAGECRLQKVCHCKIFGICMGILTTEPNDKYPLHHANHYCKFYGLCGDDLPEHLRGAEWRSSSGTIPSTMPPVTGVVGKPSLEVHPGGDGGPEVHPDTAPVVVPVTVSPQPPTYPTPATDASSTAPIEVPAASAPLPVGVPMGGAEAAHWGEQTGVPITVVPMGGDAVAPAPVAQPAAQLPAGVHPASDIPGAEPIAPLASESITAELPFKPDDASTCVSVSVSTTDDWCQNTCKQSCPPQICSCEGDRNPAVPTAAPAVSPEVVPVVSPAAAAAPFTAKDSLSCLSISTSVTDEWCKINCGSTCPATMCSCDEAAADETESRKKAAAADSPASPFATEEAPRYENGAPKPPEWTPDERNFVGGDLSCASVDGQTSDSWCQLNCATASAHPEVSCPKDRCDCSAGAVQAGQAKSAEAMDNWKEAEARIRSAEPETSYPDGLPPADEDSQLPVAAGVPKDLQSCKAVAKPASDRWCRQICATGVCPQDKCKCKGGNSDMANWNAAEDQKRAHDGVAAGGSVPAAGGNVPSRAESEASWTEAEAKVKADWPAGVHGPETGSDEVAKVLGSDGTPAPATGEELVVAQQRRAAEQAAAAERAAVAAAPIVSRRR